MIIKYISCDGSEVEEKIVKVEFCQNCFPPHGIFLSCTRENGEKFGEKFEIYDLTKIKYIKAIPERN